MRIIIFIIIVSSAFAQLPFRNPSGLSFNLYTNSIAKDANDWFTGFELSLGSKIFNLQDFGTFIAGVDWRPGGTRILVKENDTLYYIYREKRTLLNLGMRERYFFNDYVGIYGELLGGLYFTNYAGIKNSGVGNTHYMIGFGGIANVSRQENTASLRVGIRYINFSQNPLSPLYLFFNFGFSIY